MTFKAAIKYLRKPASLSGLALLATTQVSAAVLDWGIYRSNYTISNPPYTETAGRSDSTIFSGGTIAVPTPNVQVVTRTLVNVNSTGVDIKVTVSGDYLKTSSTAVNGVGLLSPQVSHLSWDPSLNGLRDSESASTSTVPKNPLALVLDMDFATWNEAITVTFDFLQTGTSNPVTVQNVSFEVYDVDYGDSDGNNSLDYVDQVRNINSTYTGNTTTNATLTGAALLTGNTSSPFASVQGGTSIYGIGPNANQFKNAHGTVQFGTSGQILMNQFALTYGNYNDFDGSNNFLNSTGLNGLTANNEPSQQLIGIGNINFSATPEAGTVIGYAAALGCLGLVFNRRRKR